MHASLQWSTISLNLNQFYNPNSTLHYNFRKSHYNFRKLLKIGNYVQLFWLHIKKYFSVFCWYNYTPILRFFTHRMYIQILLTSGHWSQNKISTRVNLASYFRIGWEVLFVCFYNQQYFLPNSSLILLKLYYFNLNDV